MATKLNEEGSVKLLSPGESPRPIAQDRILSEDARNLPANFIVAPMIVLKTPEPIRKKKRS